MKGLLGHSRQKGFTLIELLVGMMIFSVGITSIFLLLHSTFKSVTVSRNEIIVANLLREQIELVRNIRDTNIRQNAVWDSGIQTGSGTIENDFGNNKSDYQSNTMVYPVTFKKINPQWSDHSEKNRFEKTQLCFDVQKRYVHCAVLADPNKKRTPFASYIDIQPLKYDNGTREIKKEIGKDSNNNLIMKEQGYIIDARVIVRDGNNYREYDARTMITDWIR